MTLVTKLAFFKFLYPNKWWHPLFSYTSVKSQGPLEPCFTLSSISRTSLSPVDFTYYLFNLRIFLHVYTIPQSLLLPLQWPPSSILRGYELATTIGVCKNLPFSIFFKSTWAQTPAAHLCPQRRTVPQVTGHVSREALQSSGPGPACCLWGLSSQPTHEAHVFTEAIPVSVGPSWVPPEALLLPRKCQGALCLPLSLCSQKLPFSALSLSDLD